jgi:hypothetical protein
MTHPDPPREAARLLDLAGDRGITVRLIGGVAVVEHCHGPQPVPLRRACADIDLAGRPQEGRKLRQLLADAGYTPNERFNAIHGGHRLLYYDDPNSRQVDVFLGTFKMCHTLDLSDRLSLDPRTLSPADLLLTKLQVVELNAKDLTDAASLLLWHEIGQDRAGDVLGLDRLVEVTSHDWGWYTTFGDNLAEVAAAAPEILPGEQATVIRDRAGHIVAEIRGAPKSMRWKARSRIGRRVTWFELPDEVG